MFIEYFIHVKTACVYCRENLDLGILMSVVLFVCFLHIFHSFSILSHSVHSFSYIYGVWQTFTCVTRSVREQNRLSIQMCDV